MINQDVSIVAIILVKIILQFALGIALFGDQAFKPSAACIAQDHVRAEQAPEQEAVELRFNIVAD